jgi:selenocysteine lyase/cysteine desulfurase
MIRCSPNKFLHYNYVCALLNDLYCIQSRGGCQCAGPYSQRLMGMDIQTSQAFENALLDKQEFLRPGKLYIEFDVRDCFCLLTF